MSDRAPCCCMMLCVRANGLETAGHCGPVTENVFLRGAYLPARAEAEERSMQQAAFKVCRVACREVCPPGVYPELFFNLRPASERGSWKGYT